MTLSLFCSFAPAVALLATGLFAAPQDQTRANREAFDVVSIKPVEDCPRTNSAITPGRLQFDCVSVRGLIRTAYGAVNGMILAARDISVVGGPSWLDTDVYNIAAKTDTRATTAEIMGPMLRSLLEDRFQLKVHKEPRETSVYELAISGAKLNLQAIKDGDCTPIDLTNLTLSPRRPGEAMPKYCGGSRSKPNSTSMTVEFFGNTMEELAGRKLANYLDRPVVDKTGLTGRFNFQLEFVPQNQSGAVIINEQPTAVLETAPDAGPTIFQALAKLGLRLSPSKSALDVLVVDHVERPSEN
jgi:uncharacterized protein (TIGR03435 family)